MAFNTDWLDDVHSSIINDKLTEKIQDKAKWPIFVYDWINFEANTESGLKPANSQRNAFYQWTEIVKGNTSTFLNPMNSTILNKVRGDSVNSPSYYDVDYQKDNSVVFYGIKISNGGGTTFGSSSFGGFGDFTTISDQESIQMKTTQKISKELLTKFFYIPDVAQIIDNNNAGEFDQQFNDNDIFYISSYTNYFNENNGDFLYSEITFENLQQNMAQSGQIIEQHIYLGSPGSGYLVPKLLFDANGTAIGGKDGWEWNTQFTKDKGIKTLQIELTGNAGIAGLEIWGYPVDPKHNDLGDKRWYAPRKLGVAKFKLPLQEEFYKVSPNNNEYMLADTTLEATTDFNGYRGMTRDLVGDKRMDYQGIIKTTKDVDQLTSQQQTVQDKSWGYNDDFVKTHSEFGKWYVGYNQWFTNGYDKNGNLKLGQEYLNLGNVPTIDGKAGSVHRMTDLINLMSFALQPINRLPFETSYKLTWSLQDITGFGSFLNKATFGLPINWRNITSATHTLYPGLLPIPMFMGLDFYKMAASSIYASNKLKTNSTNGIGFWDFSSRLAEDTTDQANISKIPLDMFQKAESDTLGAVFSNKSNSTTLTFTLSDKLYARQYKTSDGSLITESDGKTPKMELISSVMLNQDNNGITYKYSDDSHFVDPYTPGGEYITDVNGDRYIITNIGFRAIGDGDVRITAFNIDIDNIDPKVDWHNYIAFQTYMKTAAGYKNNQVREWFTDLNTSFLDALDKDLKHKFDWPSALPQIDPKVNLQPIKPDIYPVDNMFMWDEQYGDYNGWPLDRNYQRDYSIGTKGRGNVLNSSYDIKLADIKDYGYENWNSLLTEYSDITFNIEDLYLALTRIGSNSSAHGQYGAEGYWKAALNVLNNKGVSDWELDGDSFSETHLSQIQHTLNLKEIPLANNYDNDMDNAIGNWDSGLDDSYIYANKLVPGTWKNGDYNLPLYEALSYNSSLKNRSNIDSNWYWFVYRVKNADGNIEIRLRIFFDGHFDKSSDWNKTSDNYAAFFSMALYIGGNSLANNWFNKSGPFVNDPLKSNESGQPFPWTENPNGQPHKKTYKTETAKINVTAIMNPIEPTD